MCAQVGIAVHGTEVTLRAAGFQARLAPMTKTKAMTAEQTVRLSQLNSEMRDLIAEVESLQERALRRVDEIDNDFYKVELHPEVKEMFRRLQILVTKV